MSYFLLVPVKLAYNVVTIVIFHTANPRLTVVKFRHRELINTVNFSEVFDAQRALSTESCLDFWRHTLKL